jgi:hypothetical protein
MGEKTFPKNRIHTKNLVGLSISFFINRDLIDTYIFTTYHKDKRTHLPTMLFVNKKQTTLIVKMTCNFPTKKTFEALV